MVAATVCFSFLIGGLREESFMVLASAAFSFYFANKPTDPRTNEIIK